MVDQLNSLKNTVNAFITTGGIFLVSSTFLVGLRILSRSLFKIQYGLEDWFLLASAICLWLNFGLQLGGILAGKKASNMMDSHFLEYLKYMYLSGLFYFPAIFFANLSILSLYRRLFITPGFQRITVIMITISIAWFVPAFLVELFTCWPIQYFWNPTIKGGCIYYSTFWLVIGITEIVIDLTTFFLPLREITKLQLSLQKKLLLGAIFSLGGLSIATGIARLTQSYIYGSSYIDLAHDALWCNIHISTAVLSACLPTLRPLVSRTATSLSKSLKSSRFGSSGSRSTQKSKNNIANDRYQQLDYSVDNVQLADATSWVKNANRRDDVGNDVPRTATQIV